MSGCWKADIEACFDSIDHTALMGRVRRRVGDKRVLDLVKAFLQGGHPVEDGIERDTATGTPQGGILSPLLANIALSGPRRALRRGLAGDSGSDLSTRQAAPTRAGQPTAWSATRTTSWSWWPEPRRTPKPCGRRAQRSSPRWAYACRRRRPGSCHIDEGFDFLGFRIQRHRKRGTNASAYVYTYPSKKALASVVRAGADADPQIIDIRRLPALLRRLNPVLRGWTNYFRHGVSKATFGYLDHYTWHRVVRWLPQTAHTDEVAVLRRRYLPEWRPTEDGVVLFEPRSGDGHPLPLPGRNIPTPWTETEHLPLTHRHGLVESRMRGDTHVRFGGRAEET